MDKKGCQTIYNKRIYIKTGWFTTLYTNYKLSRGAIKRIVKDLKNRLIKRAQPRPGYYKKYTNTIDEFKPGELVRIRSKEEIESTFEESCRLKGCGFMPEMWKYCGTKQKVKKNLKRFIDERDHILKMVNGVVLLEGLTCDGKEEIPCDRSCYYFWRIEWIEKLENQNNHSKQLNVDQS